MSLYGQEHYSTGSLLLLSGGGGRGDSGRGGGHGGVGSGEAVYAPGSGIPHPRTGSTSSRSCRYLPRLRSFGASRAPLLPSCKEPRMQEPMWLPLRLSTAGRRTSVQMELVPSRLPDAGYCTVGSARSQRPGVLWGLSQSASTTVAASATGYARTSRPPLFPSPDQRWRPCEGGVGLPGVACRLEVMDPRGQLFIPTSPVCSPCLHLLVPRLLTQVTTLSPGFWLYTSETVESDARQGRASPSWNVE